MNSSSAKPFTKKYIFGLLILFFVSVLSMLVGPVEISYNDVFVSFGWIAPSAESHSYADLIINDIRLPRTLLCIAIGANLGLCGAVMQGLFRNPLADPSIIGVSSGASLGAALVIVVFGSFLNQFPIFFSIGALPLFAFLGGLISTYLVYRLGTNKNGTSVTMMLLAGIAIGALSGALLGLLNYVANEQELRNLSLWSMGSLAGASWDMVILSFIFSIFLLLIFFRYATALNAFLLGESEARYLGIKVERLKKILITLSALGVGITVAAAGPIGFIGLVVPHLGRMAMGPNHRFLIPLSALLGAFILLISDMVARIVIAPQELPVGIITAALGAPFFIYLLLKQKRAV